MVFCISDPCGSHGALALVICYIGWIAAGCDFARDFPAPSSFHQILEDHGVEFFTGVPDSLLKNYCAHVTDDVGAEDHPIAANEGGALAAAAGHYLATGRTPLVYLQNSGLGNIVNPLLSLSSKHVYGLPSLLLIGW